MKIQTGCLIQLEYKLLDPDGETIESSAEGGPMEYTHGIGELPPPIEKALDGQAAGFEVVVTLPAGEAYGDYDPEQIVSVPRDQFPPDAEIVKGDWIEIFPEAEEESGEDPDDFEPREVRVVEISPDAISLDLNHPLAGVEVTFDLRVLAVHESASDLSS